MGNLSYLERYTYINPMYYQSDAVMMKNHILFDEFGTKVMPAFGQELTELKGVIEGQVLFVEGIKNKVLAAGVSVAVAGANLAAAYISRHYLHSDGGSDGAP